MKNDDDVIEIGADGSFEIPNTAYTPKVYEVVEKNHTKSKVITLDENVVNLPYVVSAEHEFRQLTADLQEGSFKIFQVAEAEILLITVKLFDGESVSSCKVHPDSINIETVGNRILTIPLPCKVKPENAVATLWNVLLSIRVEKCI
jgi:hypothetical protein